MIDSSEQHKGSQNELESAVKVVVSNQAGLHARPAAKLAQEAQKFTSDIVLKSDSQEADAKSILDILTLSAAKGTTLELRAEGVDASNALDCLTELFRERFGEEK